MLETEHRSFVFTQTRDRSVQFNLHMDQEGREFYTGTCSYSNARNIAQVYCFYRYDAFLKVNKNIPFDITLLRYSSAKSHRFIWYLHHCKVTEYSIVQTQV